MDINELIKYLTNNLPLFSIAIVIFYISFRNLKVRREESLLFIAFMIIVLFLTIVVEIEKYSQAIGNVYLGTIFTSIGYITRPILLYIFILLANMQQKRSKLFYNLCFLSLVLNTLVYLLPLFFNVPVISKLVFYYQMNDNGTASFIRGTPLNFFSHLVSLVYLGVLVYVAILTFHGKHRRDGIVIILCAFIILTTVIVEMAVNRNDLLNIVCGICAMINFIFIKSVNASRDSLTNLYDRRTYYEDISRFKPLVNGIIQIDMNELKFLNDTYGHNSGDIALIELANLFLSCVDESKMCVYRLSGDEFLILMFNGREEVLNDTVTRIRDKLEDSTYSIALGSFYIDKENNPTTFEEAMRKSEELMYKDKEAFYIKSGHEKR